MCTRDLLAYRSPDLDAIYPELVASADGSITAADVEKRRQARALQMHKSDQMDAQFQLLMDGLVGVGGLSAAIACCNSWRGDD